MWNRIADIFNREAPEQMRRASEEESRAEAETLRAPNEQSAIMVALVRIQDAAREVL
jgi:NADH:ubiquinone oxidoreductase subunit E